MFKLTPQDWIRILGYIAGLSTVAVSKTITDAAAQLHVPPTTTAIIITYVGYGITAATLIYSVAVKSVPAGFNTVISPTVSPTPDSITTKAEVKTVAAVPVPAAPVENVPVAPTPK